MYGNSDVIIGDPARLAAGVVSGIGFLGAGTILQYGNRVKGLTTAASLWVCGGIGLAMGSGFYLGGIVTAAISMLTLRGLGIVEKSFMTKNTRILFVSFYERAGVIGEVGQILGRNDILIRDMRILGEDIEDAEEGKPVKRLVEATFNLKFPAVCSQSSFMTELLDVRGIVSAKWL